MINQISDNKKKRTKKWKRRKEGTPVASLGRHPYSLIRSISGSDRFSRMASPLFVPLWLVSVSIFYA